MFLGHAYLGAAIFGFLAILHSFVWVRQRTFWSAQFAFAFALLMAVYALDRYTQPQGGQPSLLGTVLGMASVISATLGIVDYVGLSGRLARQLRLASLAIGAVVIVLVALGAMPRPMLFSVYGLLLLVQGLMAGWAMVHEPRSGHGFVLLAVMMYPLARVAVALGWIDLDALRYIIIAPSAMLGTTVLTTGLVRAQKQATEELRRRAQAEQHVQQLAFYDPLTELPNRRMMMDVLHKAIGKSRRMGTHGALLFIDLDHFKDLNDSKGHSVGDQLLRQAAQRLRHCMRQSDAISRLGGDEFVVILQELSSRQREAAVQAETVGEKIRLSLAAPYELAGKTHHSTCSIGVCLFQSDDEGVDDLLKQADLAMYQAKASGRNTLHFFDASMQADIDERIALEQALREALRQEEFVLYFQPQIGNLGELSGAEALIRWRHPIRGLVPPAHFIPLAEATGLILPMGEWVLRTACRQLVTWRADPRTAGLTLSVNVSTKQFREPGFVHQVLSAVRDTGADPACLKLELTESLLAEDIEAVIAKMQLLKNHGIGFALDDFGTGYSSLSYLKRLPLDQLKIDQSFVRDVLTDHNDATIARIIITLGFELGLNVIAEGVETQAQREFLIENGCFSQQGYLFGKPMPIAEFNDYRPRSMDPVATHQRDAQDTLF
jgi:diguanylate cyclase (GGDEF)-like protein